MIMHYQNSGWGIGHNKFSAVAGNFDLGGYRSLVFDNGVILAFLGWSSSNMHPFNACLGLDEKKRDFYAVS
jgi:tetrahydromethanopterin S-methyltransferase subunit C